MKKYRHKKAQKHKNKFVPFVALLCKDGNREREVENGGRECDKEFALH